MSIVVPRSVRLLAPQEDHRFNRKDLSIKDFESDHGYVLLGEPGLGKSTEFDRESKRVGAQKPVSARDFLRVQNDAQHPTTPIFIDGFDEVRANTGNPQDMTKQIITRLENLGCPKFRLTCQSGSWFSKESLQRISLHLDITRLPVLLLNPLSNKASQQIINEHRYVHPNLEQKAHQHGLESFVHNPLLLQLLLKAIKYNGWCNTPVEIFKGACYQLVRENALIFNNSQQKSPTPDEVLSHAGLLCMLMLIGNKTGWTLNSSKNQDTFSLHDVVHTNRRGLQTVLKSSFFKGNARCRMPIHRLLAEFLGAYYLSGKIQQGLPWKRVFSLLMGADGRPLHDLHGIAAWLSTFNSNVRSNLIHSDPSVFAFNGDLSGFTDKQRQTLRLHLEHQMDFREVFPSAPSIGALAAPQEFSKTLNLTASSDREENRLNFVDFMLSSIIMRHDTSRKWSQSSLVAEQDYIIEQVLKILYDPSWKSQIRLKSLDILNHMIDDKSKLSDILINLLHDVKALDDSSEIFAATLTRLLPDKLPLNELWGYFAIEMFSPPFDALQNAISNLIDVADHRQIKTLLTTLCDQAAHVIPTLYHINASDLVLKLLIKGLNKYGDQADISELYLWFQLVEFNRNTSQLIPAHCTGQTTLEITFQYHTSIIEWLNERKSLSYKLIEFGLKSDTQRKKRSTRNDALLVHKFLGTHVRYEFRLWCLNRAIELADTQPSVSIQLATWSTLERRGWSKPMSDHHISEKILRCPNLVQWNEQRLIDNSQERNSNIAVSSFESTRQHELTFLRQRADEVAEGRCAPDFLDKLAGIYFSGRRERQNTPTHFSNYLNEDQTLIDTVLQGFRSILILKNLPELEDITEMHQHGERSLYARPFLAALEEGGETAFSELSETGKRRALGFYLVTEMPQQETIVYDPLNASLPSWYQSALSYDPKAVADAMVSIHRANVKSGFYPTSHFLRLSTDEAYAKVAPMAVSKKMITIFPTKCSGYQLQSLHATLLTFLHVYSGGSEELQKDNIRHIILKRLERKNLDVAQQALLLSAQLCISHHQCLPNFQTFLSTGRKARIRHVLNFFECGGTDAFLKSIRKWKPDDLRLFIQLIVRQTQPPTSHDSNYEDSLEIIPKTVQDLISPCIQEISKHATHESRQALIALIGDQNLIAWTLELKRAFQDQTYRLRGIKRNDLLVPEILQTIRGGPPSNMADLKSLSVEILQDELMCTDEKPVMNWQQYWKSDTNREPLHESTIRDLLIPSLTNIAKKKNIDVYPEEGDTDHKRVAMALACDNDVRIPVVIKTNLSPYIWSDLSQLPESWTSYDLGYAIYLAIWFGDRYTNVVSPSGRLPKTAKQFKCLLDDQIDQKSMNLITVIVIDASVPIENSNTEIPLHSHPRSLTSVH